MLASLRRPPLPNLKYPRQMLDWIKLTTENIARVNQARSDGFVSLSGTTTLTSSAGTARFSTVANLEGTGLQPELTRVRCMKEGRVLVIGSAQFADTLPAGTRCTAVLQRTRVAATNEERALSAGTVVTLGDIEAYSLSAFFDVLPNDYLQMPLFADYPGVSHGVGVTLQMQYLAIL